MFLCYKIKLGRPTLWKSDIQKWSSEIDKKVHLVKLKMSKTLSTKKAEIRIICV